MSAKLVIIIVGIILIALPVISVLGSRGSGSHLVNPKVGMALGALGVLLVIFASYSSDVAHVTSQMEQVSMGNRVAIEGPVDSVRVISPVEADSVDCRILSMGVYPKGHEQDIWVVLKPTDDRYYPQSDHTNTSYKRGGEWQVVTRFGGDLEEKYELIVYETDAAATQFFSDTIQQWNDQGSYPGLLDTEIPEGATEVDRINVYLGKNCRGVF